MMSELSDAPLLWRTKNRPEVTNARGLASVIADWDVEALVAEYVHDREVAPRRPERGKKFLVDEHDGVPASNESTNRFEEHLALALFNLHRKDGQLTQETGHWIRVVDYQVPLKARRTDAAGKIDLVALLEDGSPCLIELKTPNGRGDSPFRALLEVLSYSAVVEANRKAFDAELNRRRPETLVDSMLTLLVLGPSSWWSAWLACAPAGDWRAPLAALSHELARRLNLRIAFAALDGFDSSGLTLGLNGEAPRVLSLPHLIDVPGLPSLPTP